MTLPENKNDGSVRRIVACDGNFCRGRGATIDEIREIGGELGAEVIRAPCVGACFFSPVISVMVDDTYNVFYEVHGDRSTDVVDWLRHGGDRPDLRTRPT